MVIRFETGYNNGDLLIIELLQLLYHQCAADRAGSLKWTLFASKELRMRLLYGVCLKGQANQRCQP